MADMLELSMYLFISYLSILVNGASDGNSISEKKTQDGRHVETIHLSIYILPIYSSEWCKRR